MAVGSAGFLLGVMPVGRPAVAPREPVAGAVHSLLKRAYVRQRVVPS